LSILGVLGSSIISRRFQDQRECDEAVSAATLIDGSRRFGVLRAIRIERASARGWASPTLEHAGQSFDAIRRIMARDEVGFGASEYKGEAF
jgi:hypothetical protein